MQNRTLSLLLGTALIIPSLAMAAPIGTDNITPAELRAEPVDNTLQAEIEGPDGELLATQPGEVESDEMVVETTPEEMNDADMVEDSSMMEDPDMSQDPDMTQDPSMAQDPDMMANSEAMNNPEAMNDPDSEQVAPATALNQQHSNTEYQPLIAGEANNDGSSNVDSLITLQEKKKDSRGELLATQPAQVEFKENRRVVVR